MPACFQLFRKSEGQNAAPCKLNTIDEELCKLLGKEIHPTLYVGCWFDYIGFKLAIGKTFAQIREAIAANKAEYGDTEFYDDMLKMADYLDENFSPSAWTEIGRR